MKYKKMNRRQLKKCGRLKILKEPLICGGNGVVVPKGFLGVNDVLEYKVIIRK